MTKTMLTFSGFRSVEESRLSRDLAQAPELQSSMAKSRDKNALCLVRLRPVQISALKSFIVMQKALNR
jgi:hypothetical protein